MNVNSLNIMINRLRKDAASLDDVDLAFEAIESDAPCWLRIKKEIADNLVFDDTLDIGFIEDCESHTVTLYAKNK